MHKLEHALLTMSEKANQKELAGAFVYLAGDSHNYTPPERTDLDIPDGHDLLIDHPKLPAPVPSLWDE